MPVARIHGALPRPSAARLLHHARSVRRARRFHHRARDQPDVRRADRRCGRRRCGADGRAGARAAGRARARPRHADGRRAARARRSCRISAPPLGVHLVETSPVLRSARQQALADRRRADRLASRRSTSVPDGPADRRRQRVLRRAADRPVRCKQRDGWHERMVGIDGDGELAFGVAPEPIALSTMLRRRQCATRRSARSRMARRPRRSVALARRVAQHGGAALIIDYGHAAERARRHAAGGRRHALRRSAGRCRATSISPRMSISPRWRDAAEARGRARRTARSTRASSCAGSASTSAPRGCKASATPAAGAPRSMAALARLTGEGRDRAWASCSRCWRSPHPPLGALPGFDS